MIVLNKTTTRSVIQEHRERLYKKFVHRCGYNYADCAVAAVNDGKLRTMIKI